MASRTSSAIAGIVVVVAVAVAVGIIAIVLSGRTQSPGTAGAPEAVDFSRWWAGTHQHVTDLQKSLDDSKRALNRMDGPALDSACQRMHDAAGVGLVAHLPAPDADLTAELEAVAADAHDAAHMCLAVLEQSLNSYDAEFTTRVDQADRHLKEAVAVVNRQLAQESRSSRG
ncbi:hypothetical protein [Mycolicibacterium gilvum]|uniref:Alanine and proline rich membrane protein n=1 Tax=Mycolicibacterium gilvum (strain DSM 45189 / LMG 24558 / Spyr1) TaxID=278137 RepID=E6TE47_MYCSR|nr:hypothetical protein [Mycolicibacterium gilvum]ADU00956.1 hypothetical protein Mspyr1_44000 [Mycolicibacterium gilvum Spyr1]